MSSSKSLQGLKKKASSNDELLGFDLLYILAYLSSVSASGIPRNQIFALAAGLSCTTSVYFQSVHQMVEGLNYQYSEACRAVGEDADNRVVRSLFLRLSSALSSGEREQDFMMNEAEIQAELYGNEYERKLETLQKWTDSYVALMISVALIIVVAAISMVIYDVGTTFVLGMVVVMLLVSAGGAWVLYRTAPREIKALTGELAEQTQKKTKKLFNTLLPTAFVVGSLGFVLGISPGIVLVAIGAIIFPIGYTAAKLDRAISKQDSDLSSFLRGLGATASAIGTTPGEALGRMDFRSNDSLAEPVTQLYTLLQARIESAICWRNFVMDTGSELVNRSIRVFIDGVGLGGDAEEIGNRSAMLSRKIDQLRAKRRLISTTFGWLAVAMHVTIVFILLFIIEVVSGFSSLVTGAGVGDVASGGGSAADASLSFDFENIKFLRTMILPVVIILSFINAIAPKVTDGGYSHTIFMYISITLFTTGLNIIIAPILAGAIYNIGNSSV